ncbi:MAG TPA: NlpC/P60 family protein [Bacteroidales bacterium]|nr:NlpC/P60 family protein [Bacteroidales bacterium]
MKHKSIFIILIILSIILPSCYIQKRKKSFEKTTETREKVSEKNFYQEYSEKLNVKLKGNEDKELIKEISTWLGVPYKYAGNTKNGTDCSGFTQAVYLKVYGISLYRNSYEQLKNIKPINKTNLQAGDLIFFTDSNNKVSHVGIYISDNKFIHASTQKGVIINDLNEAYYKKRFYMAGRVINNKNK